MRRPFVHAHHPIRFDGRPVFWWRVGSLILILLIVVPSQIASSSSTFLASHSRDSTPSPVSHAIQISPPRLPVRPVEGAERIDIAVTVTNTSTALLANLTTEIIIVNPAGEAILDVRQSGLTLQPESQQDVFWEWRLPADLLPGRYAVRVQAFDPLGSVLRTNAPPSASLQVVARSGLTQLTAPASLAQASPYICGANLDAGLVDRLAVARASGVTTVRFPPTTSYRQTLAQVKAAGLQPMIILHGLSIPDAAQRLAINAQLVREAQQIFGPQTRLFYEIGNENDLEFHVDAPGYTAMWNSLVPQLKTISPVSWFGGPVNYQADPVYAASFVHAATPKPDFVSWHEYTCPSSASSDRCLQAIANWPIHVARIRHAIEDNGDRVPPMMITEWNYAPDAGVPSDEKHTNSSFLSRWTALALRSMVENDLYGAYQFNVSGAIPILDSSQGQTFQSICQPIATGGMAVASPPGSGRTMPMTSAASTGTTSVPRPDTLANGRIMARDTFGRLDQPFWGAATDGQVWEGGANQLPVFAIRHGQGQVSGPPGAYDAILGPEATDAEVEFTGSLSGFLDANLGAVLRWHDANNWYKAYLDGSALVIQKRVNGAYTVLGATPLVATANTAYSMRFRAAGSILYAKAWVAENHEPPDWMLTATDEAFQSGRSGLRVQIAQDVTASYSAYTSYQLLSPHTASNVPLPSSQGRPP